MKSLVAAAAVLAVWKLAESEPPARAGGRLELGAARTHLVGSGIRVEVRNWTHSQGAGSGRVWIAFVDPPKTRMSVLPAVEPKPLRGILAGTRGDAVGINGGFYDEEGEPLGLVLSGQRVLHPLARGGGSGILVIGSSGASIVHVDAFDRSEAWYALQSIDRLVDGGKIVVPDRDGMPRDARSIAAVDGDGKLVLVAIADERAITERKWQCACSKGEGGGPCSRRSRVTLGRKSTTTGPTLAEIAELVSRAREDGGLGAVSALNLDGGFSTAFHAKVGGEEIAVEGYRGTINAVRAVPLSTPLPVFAGR